MKPLGVAIIVATVLCVSFIATSETVHVHTLIHWPSAILVLGVTLGVLMVWQPTYRWRRFLAFLNDRSKESRCPANAGRQRALAGFLTAASRSALIAGLAGELLGIFMILTAKQNPAALEPGISIATVSLLYGFMLSELVFHQMRKRISIGLATTASSVASPTVPANVRPQHVRTTHQPAAR